MQRWFISDTHFGHENIIRYCNRPFRHADEMDEFMVQEWNKLVKPEDHITHLGDVTMNRGGRPQQEAFIRLMSRLNGHKRLHLGNHDHFPVKVYLEAGFEKVYATWRDDSGILFSHIPVHPLSIGSAQANVHGHIHDHADYPPIDTTNKYGKKVKIPYLNISVEKTGYKPIHIDQILERINS